MSTFKKCALGALLICLMAAKGGKHSVWLVVSNSSTDRQPVTIRFSVAGKDQEILLADQQVIAGTQQLPERKIKEGVYQAVISAESNQIEAAQPFTLDSDRWILVNYIKEDSASIVRNYGWIDPARFRKVGDKYATINVSVNSYRPAGL